LLIIFNSQVTRANCVSIGRINKGPVEVTAHKRTLDIMDIGYY